MNSQEKKNFTLFKKQIIATYLRSNSGYIDVKKWSGEDIASFQEDLSSKINTTVSEKWFYNYFKNDPEKLPRIDMLNILSKYIGYENWEEFKQKNTKKRAFNYIWLLLGFLIIIFFVYNKNSENTFHFCFLDGDKNEQITIAVEIKVLKENESPLFFKSDINGCFDYKSKDDLIKFIVSSSYYKTDTIIRQANSIYNTVKLATDDYALMLDYYTNSKVKNWNERKKELEKLFDDKAIIYQLYSKNIGVEIYTKEEFINLLTIPTSSLKRIKIIDKEFKNNRITKLKFIIE